MSDTGWVLLGFTVAYGSMAVYAATLRLRLRRARSDARSPRSGRQ